MVSGTDHKALWADLTLGKTLGLEKTVPGKPPRTKTCLPEDRPEVQRQEGTVLQEGEGDMGKGGHPEGHHQTEGEEQSRSTGGGDRGGPEQPAEKDSSSSEAGRGGTTVWAQTGENTEEIPREDRTDIPGVESNDDGVGPSPEEVQPAAEDMEEDQEPQESKEGFGESTPNNWRKEGRTTRRREPGGRSRDTWKDYRCLVRTHTTDGRSG